MLQELREAKSEHQTGMVSFLISQGSSLSRSVQQLQSELTTADNIKDRHNRSAVKTALKDAIQHLRSLRSLPANGLAVYSGCWI